jgi:hypothetical protein
MAPVVPHDHRSAHAPPAATRALQTVHLALVALVGLGATTFGCDGTPPALDAATAPTARMSALSLRLDATVDKPTTLTALGFRAAFSGVAAADVLGMVDPLSGSSPVHDCQIRDLDNATGRLARAGGIELEEMTGLGIAVAELPGAIHPSARLYPDVAPAIGGVVSETGPLTLPAWPAFLRVTAGATAESGAFESTVAVPAPARITAINGSALQAGAAMPVVTGDLTLALGPGATDGAIEVRPFGATVALVCRIPSDAGTGGIPSFIVSHQLLSDLVAATGAAPGAAIAASLDLVRRQSGDPALADTHIAVEARASSLVELRP